jgi:hypothetical protein
VHFEVPLSDFLACAKAMLKRTLGAGVACLALAFLFASLTCAPAYADVGVVLNESLDTSVARITGSGHSAVYFSRICPDGPVKLRLCGPGEQGSVMSNYTTLGEDQPFEWNIVPLSIYLYGVEDPAQQPVYGSEKIKHALEERYREEYLDGYCESKVCRTGNGSEWREMVGARLSRSIYIFVVATTVEQDQALIVQFNSLPNENHFNGVTRNCADFTRRVINTYFPHAVSPDYINDFGMTSPKAIARSFSRYAMRHPESQYRALHYAQLPGRIKRSTEARAGTEQLYHSKKLLVPMLIFADHELPFVAASYLLTGRFNPEHESEEHPTVEITEADHAIDRAKAEKDEARVKELEVIQQDQRADVVGTSKEWKDYKKAFSLVVEEAVRNEIIPNRKYLDRFYRRLESAGTLSVDADGASTMEVSAQGEKTRVGLSTNNILARGSDPELAYVLMLTRIERVLKSPKHSRETMSEFKKDWVLLQDARTKTIDVSGSASQPGIAMRSGVAAAISKN